MNRIDSNEDFLNGVITYALSNGKRVRLRAWQVREYGAAEILRKSGYGHLLSNERVKVMQGDRCVGTVSADFDPPFIKSRSFLYDPRSEDFRREGDVWIASRTLGPGDFECIPDFIRGTE